MKSVKNSNEPKIFNRRVIVKGGLAGLAIGLSNNSLAAEEIPIGIVVGLTGAAGSFGTSVLNATKLVFDDINRKGGIKSKGGAKIKLIISDHQSQAAMAGSLTERMIEVEKVICLIGNAFSAASIVGGKAAEAGKTPMLSSDVSDELTEQGHKYFFRIGPRASFLSNTAIDFAIESARSTNIVPKKIGILTDDTGFSQAALKGLLQAYIKTGWNKPEIVTYQFSKVSDFSSIVQRLKLLGIDLLFQLSYPADAINIVRAMKIVDYSPMATIYVAGAPYTPDFINGLKLDSNFVTCSLGFVPELVSSNKYLSDFNKLYENTYKRPLDDQASQGALIAGTIYEALERSSQLTRESVTSALRSIDIEVGVNPYIARDGVRFDSRGDNSRVKGLVMQLRDLQQKIVYPANIATTKLVWPIPKWSDR